MLMTLYLVLIVPRSDEHVVEPQLIEQIAAELEVEETLLKDSEEGALPAEGHCRLLAPLLSGFLGW